MAFRDMSFREKSAWISFVLILLISIVYFAHVPSVMVDQGEDNEETIRQR
jgi:hypothetical protein